MKNLIRNSLVCWFLLWIFPGAEIAGQTSSYSSREQQTWIPPLGTHFEKSLFRCVLDISKNHVTGLILIKKTSDSSFRIMYSNEMGMNYFDFEFIRERFIVHYTFPSFSKTSFLKILEDDFRLLLPEDFSGKRTILGESDTGRIGNFKVRAVTGKYIYTVERDLSTIQSISSRGKLLRKTRIEFLRYGKGIPYRISVSNPTIGLKMKLTMLERQD
jgi:hypothetical protein